MLLLFLPSVLFALGNLGVQCSIQLPQHLSHVELRERHILLVISLMCVIHSFMGHRLQVRVDLRLQQVLVVVETHQPVIAGLFALLAVCQQVLLQALPLAKMVRVEAPYLYQADLLPEVIQVPHHFRPLHLVLICHPYYRYLAKPTPILIQQMGHFGLGLQRAGIGYNIQSMSIFRFFRKKESKGDLQGKLNVSTVFNKEEECDRTAQNTNLNYISSKERLDAYCQLLNSDIVDLEKLKSLAWDGVPQSVRSETWKLLLKYMPTNKENQLVTLQRKRKDYFVMVNTYIEQPSLEQDAQEKKIFKLINDDVLRTLPESSLFRDQKIQRLMRRLLYVWHMRHPASGYVQGINDVVTPFVLVFLNQHIPLNLETLDVPPELTLLSEDTLRDMEGDAYYCVSKLLDGVLDNYTSSWPGIQKSFYRIEDVIKRVDPELLQHFSSQGIDFYHMYFKWVTCLLLRQFSMKTCLRLFDTYLADESNYFAFSLYILTAIILKYSKKFKTMKFEEMMIFQQNMPTKKWDEEHLATVIAEAYVYQSYFLK